MSQPGFWDDNQQAKKTAKRLDHVKKRLEFINNIEEKLGDTEVFLEMAQQEDDDGAREEVKTNLTNLEIRIEKMELEVRLNGQYDDKNAILSIHPGAGGTESQDWAEMLLRMYERWLEKNGFEVETLDFLPGDEAGIKRVTLLIKGDYCYGYLKSERGVHRLVRISPFDSSSCRFSIDCRLFR